MGRETSMRIGDMNWMQVEDYLRRDDRCVVPLGSTEQHAYLSLSVDSILAERVAVEAADPLGVPVFPVVAYGLTPAFGAYPGTVTLRMETYVRLIHDLLDSLAQSGFRRILLVNGHGGNVPAAAYVLEWMADHPGVAVKFHNWWNAPKTWAKVLEIDPVASHASWMENFPWTRLAGVEMPTTQKPLLDLPGRPRAVGQALRELCGDGNFGGVYAHDDAALLELWAVGVEETRAWIADNWTFVA